jgi:methyl-accepting chemotaxis protein
MKIRGKFTFMVGIPIIAIAVILTIGVVSFVRIQDTIQEVAVIQDDRATMIDADRDAYQAYLAEIRATEATDRADVEAQKASSVENLQQAWDRITDPGSRFPETMAVDLAVFEEEFAEWSEHSAQVIDLSLETVTGNVERDAAALAAMAAFGGMRDVINELGEYVDELLGDDLSFDRRRGLERALSLVLNGDRDAYQAYVAQLLIVEAQTSDQLEQQDVDSADNIGQVADRVREAALIVGGNALAMKDAFDSYFVDWQQNSRKVADLSRQNFAKNITIAAETAQNAIHFQSMRDAIDRLGEQQKNRVMSDIQDMDNMVVSTITLYSVVAAVSILLTLLIVIITAMGITKALKKGVMFANQIALGDLDVELDINQRDEFGELADSLRAMVTELQIKSSVLDNIAQGDLTGDVRLASDKDALGASLRDMTGSLNELLMQVNSAVEQVSSGSGQIAMASQSLSQGAAEQASSLEEISSSLNEINGQSNRNAESATEANAVAKKAADSSIGGNERMQNLLAAMERINGSSDEIAKVVKVIDDIAFQINLLALNANVEAARAGKYGKGFAVVADEVRNLAVRSASAVKETTTMVEEVTKSIEDGTAIAQQTAQQLEEITTGSTRVAEYLGEIALASSEQAQGVEQINSGLEQVDQVTQSNTASAEESASAGEELAAQAAQLKDMVSRFKLKNDGTRTAAVAPVSQIQQAAPQLAMSSAGNREQGSKANPASVINLDDDDFKEF